MKMGTPMAMSIAMQTSRIFFNPVLKPRTIDEALHKKYYFDFFPFCEQLYFGYKCIYAYRNIKVIKTGTLGRL